MKYVESWLLAVKDNPLGLVALIVIALAFLSLQFFRQEHWPVKLPIFLIMLGAGGLLIWQTEPKQVEKAGASASDKNSTTATDDRANDNASNAAAADQPKPPASGSASAGTSSPPPSAHATDSTAATNSLTAKAASATASRLSRTRTDRQADGADRQLVSKPVSAGGNLSAKPKVSAGSDLEVSLPVSSEIRTQYGTGRVRYTHATAGANGPSLTGKFTWVRNQDGTPAQDGMVTTLFDSPDGKAVLEVGDTTLEQAASKALQADARSRFCGKLVDGEIVSHGLQLVVTNVLYLEQTKAEVACP